MIVYSVLSQKSFDSVREKWIGGIKKVIYNIVSHSTQGSSEYSCVCRDTYAQW